MDSSTNFIKWYCRNWSYIRTGHRNSRDYDSTICCLGTRKKPRAKLTIILEERETNSCKVKSPVKRKSKLINHSCKENDKKRKKLMCDNLNCKKIIFKKKRITKEKKSMTILKIMKKNS